MTERPLFPPDGPLEDLHEGMRIAPETIAEQIATDPTAFDNALERVNEAYPDGREAEVLRAAIDRPVSEANKPAATVEEHWAIIPEEELTDEERKARTPEELKKIDDTRVLRERFEAAEPDFVAAFKELENLTHTNTERWQAALEYDGDDDTFVYEAQGLPNGNGRPRVIKIELPSIKALRNRMDEALLLRPDLSDYARRRLQVLDAATQEMQQAHAGRVEAHDTAREVGERPSETYSAALDEVEELMANGAPQSEIDAARKRSALAGHDHIQASRNASIAHAMAAQAREYHEDTQMTQGRMQYIWEQLDNRDEEDINLDPYLNLDDDFREQGNNLLDRLKVPTGNDPAIEQQIHAQLWGAEKIIWELDELLANYHDPSKMTEGFNPLHSSQRVRLERRAEIVEERNRLLFRYEQERGWRAIERPDAPPAHYDGRSPVVFGEDRSITIDDGGTERAVYADGSVQTAEGHYNPDGSPAEVIRVEEEPTEEQGLIRRGVGRALRRGARAERARREELANQDPTQLVLEAGRQYREWRHDQADPSRFNAAHVALERAGEALDLRYTAAVDRIRGWDIANPEPVMPDDAEAFQALNLTYRESQAAYAAATNDAERAAAQATIAEVTAQARELQQARDAAAEAIRVYQQKRFDERNQLRYEAEGVAQRAAEVAYPRAFLAANEQPEAPTILPTGYVVTEGFLHAQGEVVLIPDGRWGQGRRVYDISGNYFNERGEYVRVLDQPLAPAA